MCHGAQQLGCLMPIGAHCVAACKVARWLCPPMTMVQLMSGGVAGEDDALLMASTCDLKLFQLPLHLIRLGMCGLVFVLFCVFSNVFQFINPYILSTHHVIQLLQVAPIDRRRCFARCIQFVSAGGSPA